MGSFTFKWDHPAEEVYATGTFDNWSKSLKLDKTVNNTFEKTLALPHTGEKIFYKFVADGVWKHDHTAKTETDERGLVNNVIEPHDIVPDIAAPVIPSSIPGASTTEEDDDEMAKGKKNKNNKAKAAAATATDKVQETTPGAFPSDAPAEDQTVSVAPIPASEGAGNPISLAAGEKVPEPSSINANTVESTVHDDPELKAADETVSVAPIPATGGIGNPVSLAPGETVPDASTLTGNTIDSNVKLDKESYEKSDAGAPVIPIIAGTGAGLLGGAALAGGAVSGLGHKTSNMIPESSLPMGSDMPADISSENVGPTISSVAPQSTTNQLAGAVPLEKRDATISSVGAESTTNQLAGAVPLEVTDSQKAAGVGPEASANPTAVEEKAQMEKELQSEIPEAPATSTISSVAPGSTTTQLAGAVPLEVAQSQKDAGAAPEAAANATAVEEKSEVEKELQSKVPEAPATSTGATEAVNGTSSDAKKDTSIAGVAAGGVAAAGAAAAGTAYALRNKTTEATGKDPVSYLPQSVQSSIDGMNKKADVEPTTTSSVPTTAAAAERTTTNEVPSIVSESQKEAHVGPEASASAAAVSEKEAMENELLKKVPESEAQGTPAPSATAATSTTAPSATTATTATSSSAIPAAVGAVGVGAVGAGGVVAADGAQKLTGAPQLADPTAGVGALSMDDKKLNAPAAAPATTNIALSPKPQLDSRDVSPMSKPKTTGQTQPTVTTGVESSKAAAESKPVTAGTPVGTPRKDKENSTPQKRNSIIDKLKGTPDSSKKSSTDSPASSNTKEKRKSFFGRLKEKLK